MFKPLLAALLLAPLATAVAAGKTYRWVDAKGRVHYGDVPTAQAEEIRRRVATATDPATALAAEGAAKVAECTRRREQLSTYTAAGTITETDALGNTREYTAGEKEKLLAKAQTQVQQACGGLP